MKTLKKLSYVCFLFIGLSFLSCSKDEETPAENEELSEIVMKEFKEKITSMKIPSAMENSNNEYAQQANAQFGAVKGLSQSYISLLTIPTSAISNVSSSTGAKTASNTKTYTWSANGVSVTYTITESSDRYTFNYSITEDGVTAKLMDGYQLIDGSYAEMKLYGEGNVTGMLKWWLKNDIAKVEITSSEEFKMLLETNLKDNSGSIKIYEQSKLTLKYSWNADGTGTYVNYSTKETHNW